VFSLAALAYSNTLMNGFVYDDRALIERNPSVQRLSGIPRIFLSPYWEGEGRSNRLYRPLTMATYALNRAAGGGGPWGFHLVNALLHGSAAVLVYLLLLRLFLLPRLAITASAIFAVHPVLTEAVSGVVGRAEILAALFVLAALLWDRSGGSRRFPVAAGSLACFALALLSKENALAYPGCLLLTDYLLGMPRGLSRRGRNLELVGVLSTAALYLLLRWKVLGSLMEIAAIPRSDNLLAGVTAGRRIVTALALAGKYLALFLFPWPLSADYSADQILPLRGIPDLSSALRIAAALAVPLVVYRYRRRLVPLSWGIGLAAVSLFLVSNIPFPIGTIFAERLLYLPLAGLCAATGCIASVAAEKRPRAVTALTAAVVLILAGRTVQRNRDWRDDFSLFRSALETSPHSARVRYNLGNAYRRRGDLGRAEELYRTCLQIAPDFDPARRNLGVVLSDMGRGEEAVALLQEALRKGPESASLRNNLGNAYRGLGRSAEAEAEYSRALELDPASADAHNNLGAVYHERGDPVRAEREYREAIRLSPDRIPFRMNLGNLLLQRGDRPGAEHVFRAAVEMDPSLPEPHRGLGEALLGQGLGDPAERELQESLKLGPDQWEAPALLGYLHQGRGEEEAAIRYYRDSLSRNPNQPELEQNLGILYAARPGGRENALEHLRRCLSLAPPPAMEEGVGRLIRQLERGDNMKERRPAAPEGAGRP
jgi:protein O-mannosyl-transferase